jgi:allantoin racemase
MRLRVVIPVVGDVFDQPIGDEVRLWAGPSTQVEVVSLTRGPASIECEYDEALAGPAILERIHEAVSDGVDAAYIVCFGDPAVHAAREIADFPVVGGFEPAILTALGLGERFGIVTVLPNVVPMLRASLRRLGLEHRAGPIRNVGLPVLGMDDRATLLDRLYRESSAMVARGDADVIVLGCGGMLGVAATLQDRLARDGAYVPVVDPTAAAVTWLERSIRLGLRPSRTTYLPPPPKWRVPGM